MAQTAETSGSLALAGKSRRERRPWAGPVNYRKVVKAQPLFAVASAPSLPVNAAEVAQARAFEKLLQAESAELHELAHRVAGTPDKHLDADGSAPSRDLMQLRARIDEVQRLLQALRGRFPQHPDADR
jgi:hypothetical protein